MSDEDDWDFAGADDAKTTIRAAIRYLLKGATGGARGDIVQEIISIVRQISNEPRTGQANPLDDDMPGGYPLPDSRKLAGEPGICGPSIRRARRGSISDGSLSHGLRSLEGKPNAPFLLETCSSTLDPQMPPMLGFRCERDQMQKTAFR
jgi:hypothetical protein